MNYLPHGFLTGFTLNSILTRLDGYRSCDDLIYPVVLFVISLVLIAAQYSHDHSGKE